MDRTLRNTVAVLLVTAFTALAIFATVQLTARVTGISSVVSAETTDATYDSTQYGEQYGQAQYSQTSASSGQVMTCPATGCTASSCHAMQ